MGKFPATAESDRHGADKNIPVFMCVQTTPYQALRYEQFLRETYEAHSDVPVRQNYGPVRFLTDRSWSIKIL